MLNFFNVSGRSMKHLLLGAVWLASLPHVDAASESSLFAVFDPVMRWCDTTACRVEALMRGEGLKPSHHAYSQNSSAHLQLPSVQERYAFLIPLAAYVGAERLAEHLKCKRLADSGRDLFEAVSEDREDEVRLLLAAGADPNGRYRPSWYYESSMLEIACAHNKPAIVRLLLQACADRGVHDCRLQSLLGTTMVHRSIDAARVLVEEGQIDFKKLDARHGWSDLYWACYYGYPEMVQLLLDHNAEVASPTSEGITPLQLAIRAGMCRSSKGRRAVIDLLLKRGADCTQRSPTPVAHWGTLLPEEYAQRCRYVGDDMPAYLKTVRLRQERERGNGEDERLH